MDQVEQKHHFLIAGNVVFVNKEAGQPGSVPLNGVLISDTSNLPARSLGKAQQVLQLNFFKNSGVDAKEVQVVDVVLLSLTYLGCFSEAEFNQPPAGMTLQQASTELDTALTAANGEQAQEADDDRTPAHTSSQEQ